MFRETVTIEDAVVAVSIMECSMQVRSRTTLWILPLISMLKARDVKDTGRKIDRALGVTSVLVEYKQDDVD